MPAGAVNVVEAPEQSSAEPEFTIVATGFAAVVIVYNELVALHPFPSTTDKLYVPAVVAVSDALVAPEMALPPKYHWYEVMPVGPESASDPPTQIAPVPVELILAVGGVFTVNEVAEVVALQPFEFVTVTV